MSDSKDEKEDTSSVPSSLSLKSDGSKGTFLDFRDRPGPSETKRRAESPVPSCLSLKSDRSTDRPLDFRDQPGPSETKGTRNTSRSRAGVQRDSQTSTVRTDSGLQEVLDEHRISLREEM
ncbi:hypothetical protein OYC64_022052 [Pagothenia borchgrevinki]|uniref:Uncharacterized protein n=1 Tax=Pagothenia borchgrevinki TaxID=8213 RepID=A0ABD2HRU0_PAGBO